jgi:hypothetical protein
VRGRGGYRGICRLAGSFRLRFCVLHPCLLFLLLTLVLLCLDRVEEDVLDCTGRS